MYIRLMTTATTLEGLSEQPANLLDYSIKSGRLQPCIPAIFRGIDSNYNTHSHLHNDRDSVDYGSDN